MYLLQHHEVNKIFLNNYLVLFHNNNIETDIFKLLFFPAITLSEN